MIDSATYDDVISRLYEVEDPEVGINIVDLGLVYDLDSTDGQIRLTLTLTSPGCPLRENIEQQSVDVLADLDKRIEFVWTFEPLWNTSRISDEGREQLYAIGGYIPTY